MHIIRIIRLGKNSRILTNFIIEMNVQKLRNNYTKNRLHDLTTDRTSRMLDYDHRGTRSNIKDCLNSNPVLL